MPMRWEIREDSGIEKSLFLDNGIIEVGIPLNYGLRISHFSFYKGENVFFEQPMGMKDLTTEEGWRIRGGHRLWIAPESEKVYYPDNEPISYKLLRDETGEGVEIIQREDPWRHIKKSMKIFFHGKSGLKVLHKVENTSDKELCCSLWAISSMAPGGVEHIPLEIREDGMDHWHRISLWDYTNLGDPRAQYTREEIRLVHLPIAERYKIGVGHPFGPVWYKNGEVIFTKSFPFCREWKYPDGNVCYETFLCKHMVEMESLSRYETILPGDSMEHLEIWELRIQK